MVYHVAADYRLWTASRRRCSGRMWTERAVLLEAALRRRRGAFRLYQHGRLYRGAGGWSGRRGCARQRWRKWLGRTSGPSFWPSRWRWSSRREGFPVVIVNPTAPVGDHDFKPTPTGKIVVDFVRGAMPAFLDTGLNVVDVRRRGGGAFGGVRTRTSRGAIYFGRGESDAPADFRELWPKYRDGKAPKLRIPYAVAYAAGMASTGLGGCYGKRTAGAARRRADGAQEDVGAA